MRNMARRSLRRVEGRENRPIQEVSWRESSLICLTISCCSSSASLCSVSQACRVVCKVYRKLGRLRSWGWAILVTPEASAGYRGEKRQEHIVKHRGSSTEVKGWWKNRRRGQPKMNWRGRSRIKNPYRPALNPRCLAIEISDWNIIGQITSRPPPPS